VVQLTQRIKDATVQADVLVQIARHYAQVERNEEARQALERALQMTQRSKNSHEKAQRVAEIAIELGKIAQYDSAIAVAQTIDVTQKDSPKALALAKIAGSYAKAGQKERVIAILSQAVKMAKATNCSY
jgi:tetratricopeptide (TPR) repeat protein